MNIKNLILVFSAILILSSCATTSFYQLYDIKPVDKNITKAENLIYEDENCQIIYNMWAEGGSIGFNMYNKTEDKIYVDLSKTHFILNGFAHDYYKNRSYTISEKNTSSISNRSSAAARATGINIYNNIQTNEVSVSSSASSVSSKGYSVSIKENSIVCIPAKTRKRISEYSINNKLLRDCDLLKYPKRKQVKTLVYTIDQSPVVFSNLIRYTIKGKIIDVENKFYISGVTNYPTNEFFVYVQDSFCGENNTYKTKYYKYYNSNKFYIEYTKGNEMYKH